MCKEKGRERKGKGITPRLKVKPREKGKGRGKERKELGERARDCEKCEGIRGREDDKGEEDEGARRRMSCNL